MNDDERVRALLRRAGMIMEDASAPLILMEAGIDELVLLLRQTAADLGAIADVVAGLAR